VLQSLPFVVRNFRAGTDFLLLLELRRDLEGEDLSEAALQADLVASNQKPEQDLWVAESSDGTALLGYSIGYHTVPERYLVWGGVRPSWRRQGIGNALLERSIERARKLDAEHILINIESQNEGSSLFLQQQGFQPKSHIWSLTVQADTPAAQPELPSGYRIQSFAEVRDYQVLYDAYYGCCYDLWGHGANSKKRAAVVQPIAKDWTQWFSNSDPKGEGIFFIFSPNGKVVGLCRGRLASPEERSGGVATGHIDALGVAPEYRPLLLELPLTFAVMRWLRERGHGPLDLEVYGIDENRLKLYQELGFVIEWHLIAYNFDL
jgi:ribosomal protein S18 acetylase RimI-like enzyme